MSCSTRQAQRVLHSLIEQGWIAVVGNPNGGAPGTTRHYQINVQKLTSVSETGDADVRGDIDVTGDTDVARRVTSTSQTGDIDVTQSVIYPSIDPSVNNKRTQSARSSKPKAGLHCPPDVSPQTFADWLEVRKAKRAGPVTQTVLDGIRREAQKAGITLQAAIEHCCLSGWQGFKAAWYLSRPAKAEKFDPVAYVNRNRISTQRRDHEHEHDIIDITPERVA
jgi:hypothetical protein